MNQNFIKDSAFQVITDDMIITYQKRMTSMKPMQSGNGMTEYILPVAVIGTLVFAGMPAVMGGLFNTFSGALGNGNEPVQNKTLKVTPLGSISQPVAEIQATDGVRPDQITLQDGTVLSITGLVNNFKERVETVGANGTTDQIAASLKALALQLKEAGKIDTDQFNKLEALANEGHNLAVYQKRIEDLAKSGSVASYKASGGALTAAYMTQNNETSPTYYVPTSQLDPKTLELFGLSTTLKSTGKGLFNLLKAYEEVASNGTLSDPAINQLVTTLSIQIKTMSYEVTTARQYAMWNLGEFPPSQLQSQMAASAESNLNASIICATGGTADTGTHCPTY